MVAEEYREQCTGGTKRQGWQGKGCLCPQNSRKLCRETETKKREKRERCFVPRFAQNLKFSLRKRDNILIWMRKQKPNHILHQITHLRIDHGREQARVKGLQMHRCLLFLLFLHSVQKAEAPTLHWEHASSAAAAERTSCPKPLATHETQTCRYGEGSLLLWVLSWETSCINASAWP